MRFLDGGCSSPVAAYGMVKKGKLVLKGLYYIEKTGDFVIGSMEGELTEAEKIGILLAEEMRGKYER